MRVRRVLFAFYFVPCRAGVRLSAVILDRVRIYERENAVLSECVRERRGCFLAVLCHYYRVRAYLVAAVLYLAVAESVIIGDEGIRRRTEIFAVALITEALGIVVRKLIKAVFDPAEYIGQRPEIVISGMQAAIEKVDEMELCRFDIVAEVVFAVLEEADRFDGGQPRFVAQL